MLALGGPSTGKTQSHKNCITQPILKEKSVVNCFLRMQAWKVCLSSFREVKIAQLCVPSMNVKNSSRTWSDSKRVPRLRRWNDYYCVMTVLTGMKWNTNKRVWVPSAALALSCLTQPYPFPRYVMPKLLASDDGLLDGFLICLPSIAVGTWEIPTCPRLSVCMTEFMPNTSRETGWSTVRERLLMSTRVIWMITKPNKVKQQTATQKTTRISYGW